MGKKRAQKDRAYLTATEWKEEHGGWVRLERVVVVRVCACLQPSPCVLPCGAWWLLFPHLVNCQSPAAPPPPALPQLQGRPEPAGARLQAPALHALRHLVPAL